MKKRNMLLFLLAAAMLLFAGCASVPGGNQSEGGGNGMGTVQPPQEGGETQQPGQEQEEGNRMYVTINGNKLEVTLADNDAAYALVELLRQGDIVYNADDYGNFEKVGSLGHTLPSDDERIEAQPGDVILYTGSQIVLFYGNNTWSYTRLGRIEGYAVSELRTLLGAGLGSLRVTLSLS